MYAQSRRSTVQFAEQERSSSDSKRKCCKKRCRATPVVRHLLIFLVLCLWLVCGTFVFYTVEYPAEVARIKEAEVASVQSSATNTNLTTIILENITTSTEAIKMVFQKFLPNYEILEVSQAVLTVRIKPVEPANATQRLICRNSSSLPHWDLSGSLFFSITTVTTIGYGQLAPSTQMGRLTTVVFATVGIPLALLVISNQAKLLTTFSRYIAKKTSRCITSIKHHSSVISRQNSANERQSIKRRRRELRQRRLAALISTLFFSLSGTIIFLLLPSILFAELEQWDYVSAVYYSFVTLTTIGFGDFVAGQEDERYYQFYRMFLCMWIFFGMAFIATFLGAMQSMIHKKTKDGMINLKRRISQSRLSLFSHLPSIASRMRPSEFGRRQRGLSLPARLDESVNNSADNDDPRTSDASIRTGRRLSASEVADIEIISEEPPPEVLVNSGRIFSDVAITQQYDESAHESSSRTSQSSSTSARQIEVVDEQRQSDLTDSSTYQGSSEGAAEVEHLEKL